MWAVGSRSFRILECFFPAPGLYWVEFRYRGKMVARQPLEIRGATIMSGGRKGLNGNYAKANAKMAT